MKRKMKCPSLQSTQILLVPAKFELIFGWLSKGLFFQVFLNFFISFVDWFICSFPCIASYIVIIIPTIVIAIVVALLRLIAK